MVGARIVVTEFASLDGVMEAPGGEPFKYLRLKESKVVGDGVVVLIYERAADPI